MNFKTLPSRECFASLLLNFSNQLTQINVFHSGQAIVSMFLMKEG